MKVVGIIPARLSSSRFPNKLFHNFMGKSILENVIDRGLQLDFIDKLVVVSEDLEIKKFVKSLYKNVDVISVEPCRFGTEKVYKYFLKNKMFDFYFYMPSDEPYFDIKQIKLQDMVSNDISTYYTKFYCEEDLRSNLSCKIIIDKEGCMLYNSRSIIPIKKNGMIHNLSTYNKHLGLFMFSNKILSEKGSYIWSKYESELANIEGLEQNRFIDLGLKVKMIKVNHIGFGIDKKHQIEILENRLKTKGI